MARVLISMPESFWARLTKLQRTKADHVQSLLEKL